MRRYRAVGGATATMSLTVAWLLIAPMHAHAEMGAPSFCTRQPPAGEVVSTVPWAQKWLDPEVVWPVSRGAGVLVAVVDSGTDANHPQLVGRVEKGFDFIRDAAGGDVDCIGHGTATASLIAARKVDGVGFTGLAPDAKILPIRATERLDGDDADGGAAVTPARMGEAIRWAVDHGASVINFSLIYHQDYPEVRAAIEYAIDKDAVVVAAVGNDHRDGEIDPPSYPAAYDGVLGVGAIDENGVRLPGSRVNSSVDLVAPGQNVIVAAPGRGHVRADGTSFAAPVVSAVAALVRAAEPRLSARAVVNRLQATASPAPGGTDRRQYGRGVVDANRAVTEGLVTIRERVAPAVGPPEADPGMLARARRWSVAERTSIALLVAVLCLVGLASFIASAWRHGSRRHWRPQRASAIANRSRNEDKSPSEDVDGSVRAGHILT